MKLNMKHKLLQLAAITSAAAALSLAACDRANTNSDSQISAVSNVNPDDFTDQQRGITAKDVADKEEPLINKIKGKYMLVKIVSHTCGACRTSVSEMQTDAELAALVKDGKCSVALVAINGLKGFWIRPGNGFNQFVSDNSYSVNEGYQAMNSAFGFKYNGYIPYSVIVDAKGKVVGPENTPETLSEFKRMCAQ